MRPVLMRSLGALVALEHLDQLRGQRSMQHAKDGNDKRNPFLQRHWFAPPPGLLALALAATSAAILAMASRCKRIRAVLRLTLVMSSSTCLGGLLSVITVS